MLKILIIEDSEVASLGLKYSLETVTPDLEITLAEDAMSGLRMLSQQDYDFVFTDIRLPDMNGIELIRRIRKEEGEKSRRKKIIALSSDMRSSLQLACQAVQADGAFAKPISFEALKEIVGI